MGRIMGCMPDMAQRHLRKVAAEAAKVERAQQGLRRAIMQAVESGETFRDIAPHAGLSKSRVQQIVQEERARE